MFDVIHLQTKQNTAYHVTPQIREIIEKSGVKDGICTVSLPHTDAGLCLHSFWDPKGWDDMMEDIRRVFPSTVDYLQRTNSPVEASAHTKSMFMGTVFSMIIKDGDLVFGNSQGVLFAEFNGPKADREVHVTVQ